MPTRAIPGRRSLRRPVASIALNQNPEKQQIFSEYYPSDRLLEDTMPLIAPKVVTANEEKQRGHVWY
jgi:hypothetical protein